LFGTINNREYFRNSMYCEFKAFHSDSIVRYSPEMIYGYRFVNGKYYISKTIELNSKKVNVFLEFLLHGKLDIYFLLDEASNSHYFVSKDSLAIKELKYSKSVKDVDDKQMLVESREYIPVLAYYTLDCNTMQKDILNLNELSVVKIMHFAEKYHNLTCKDEKCIIYEKKVPRKIKVNIGAGATIFWFSSISKKVEPNYGFDILFQQSQQSEKIYLGLGLYKAEKGFEYFHSLQIPLSISYLNPKMGFSAMYSYTFYLNYYALEQGIGAGIKYQTKFISYYLMAELQTGMLVIPVASSLKCGMTIDLR